MTDEIATLRKLARKGKSIAEAAETIGMTRGKAAGIARRNNIRFHGKPEPKTISVWTLFEKRELERLYPDMSAAEVADLLGKTEQAVYQKVKLWGLKKRIAA